MPEHAAIQYPVGVAELALLQQFDELTPPEFRRQERDAMRLEDFVQKIGRGRVGEPGTGLAMTGRSMNILHAHGFLDRIKTEGPLQYRISQLGEREIASAKQARLERELSAERNTNVELRAELRKVDEERVGWRDELDRAYKRSWWKRLVNERA